MEALHKNGTWPLTKLPPGKKAIERIKEKEDTNGEIERYKARLVARGFLQKYREDYDKTFAPVVQHSTVRMFLSIAASRKMQVKHLDIKLHVYMGISERNCTWNSQLASEMRNILIMFVSFKRVCMALSRL